MMSWFWMEVISFGAVLRVLTGLGCTGVLDAQFAPVIFMEVF